MSDLFMDMHQKSENLAAPNEINSNYSCRSGSDVDYFSGNVADNHDANEADDEISNMLCLKLKKPKHWKWELSTSRSCSNIALPRILLYDHKGRLLVDASTQDEQIYCEPIEQPLVRRPSRKRTSKAATTSLAHSIRQFDGLDIQEPSPSLLSPINSIHDTRNSSPVVTSSSCIDIFTTDLPDNKIDRRSSSLKSVRFQDDSSKSANPFQFGDLPTPPPSSNTTPTTSSSSGPREKRRYRRSHSSGQSPINSPSILERLSFNRGRFSSPEYADESEVYHPPRYFLRTSKAGTIIVQQESFSRYRRRPRSRKNSSTDHMNQLPSPRSHSSGSLQKIKSFSSQLEKDLVDAAASLENISEKSPNGRKKVFASRRRRSDGNILLQKSFSLSSEDEGCWGTGEDEDFVAADGFRRPQQKYENLKRQLKGDLVTLHPDNELLHPYGSPTER